MRANYKPKLTNRPKHLKQDDSFYFFTVKTIDGQWFLRPDKYKQLLLDIIKTKTKKFGFSLIGYVILSNHYHLIVNIKDADRISKFIGEINGTSSFAINKADDVTGRKIWWNYYDHTIRDESDFFKHLNYIHHNPIKHDVSKVLEYPFSSYNLWVKKKGKEYMDDAFAKYPIVDFMTANDEF